MRHRSGVPTSEPPPTTRAAAAATLTNWGLLAPLRRRRSRESPRVQISPVPLHWRPSPATTLEGIEPREPSLNDDEAAAVERAQRRCSRAARALLVSVLLHRLARAMPNCLPMRRCGRWPTTGEPRWNEVETTIASRMLSRPLPVRSTRRRRHGDSPRRRHGDSLACVSSLAIQRGASYLAGAAGIGTDCDAGD